MVVLGPFEEGDGLGVVCGFSRGDDDVDGEAGVDVYAEVDFVSEQGVGFGFMPPLCIGVGIGFQTFPGSCAFAELDAELVGAGPEVGGIPCGVSFFLNEAYGTGLSDEVMEESIEGVLSESGTEWGEGGMGGGRKEVEVTEEVEPDVPLELVGQISFGGSFSHVAQQQCFEQADGGRGGGSLVRVERVGQWGDEAPVYSLEGVLDGVIGMELGLGEDIEGPR